MDPERKITVHVPGELLDRAQNASGQGITETVRQGLRLLAAGDNFERVAALRGKARFSIDYTRPRWIISSSPCLRWSCRSCSAIPRCRSQSAGVSPAFPSSTSSRGSGSAGLLRAAVLKQKKKARVADALIAQTCLDQAAPLVTRDRDVRHFAGAAGLPFPLTPTGTITASMAGHPWTTTTHTASRTGAAAPGELLARHQIIQSPETDLQYRIERAIGAGGFGQAYLATRIGRSGVVPQTVCVKVSTRKDGWLREAYFGQVLDGHDRAIRVYDAFPLMHADGRVRYFLVLEYAGHGDLSAFLRRGGKGWSEAAVRREIAGILDVLRRLHRGQTLHRDLTPVNVFVCDGPRLKLGDFGIVRQQSDARGITANTMNRMTAPSDLLDRAAPKWQARDDVYQVGQLLGMLIRGDASRRIRTGDVRGLRCSDQLKEIVHRCLGERRKRYESADEMIAALRTKPEPLKAGVIRSLKGVHITFTGIFAKTRPQVAQAARRAGAIVHSGPSTRTTVIVRGRPNALQAAGREGGLKLMEIKRLREKGLRITVLTEPQFWRLTRSPAQRA